MGGFRRHHQTRRLLRELTYLPTSASTVTISTLGWVLASCIDCYLASFGPRWRNHDPVRSRGRNALGHAWVSGGLDPWELALSTAVENKVQSSASRHVNADADEQLALCAKVKVPPEPNHGVTSTR